MIDVAERVRQKGNNKRTSTLQQNLSAIFFSAYVRRVRDCREVTVWRYPGDSIWPPIGEASVRLTSTMGTVRVFCTFVSNQYSL